MPLSTHPATLPAVDVSADIDCAAVSASVLERLEAGITFEDLANNAIWRDTCAMTGTLRTFYSPGLVLKVWRLLSSEQRPCSFHLQPKSAMIMRLGPSTSWVQAMFTFETRGSRPARCSGIIGLVPEDGKWKIWMLCTTLEQPVGWPDVDNLEASEIGNPNGSSGARAQAEGYVSSHSQTAVLDCVVVGAGVGGLTMAARLKALRVSYLLIDAHKEIGEVWSKDRYATVRLHTSKHNSQMPYHPAAFGPEMPYNLKGSDVAAGFQKFVKTFDIAVQLSTVLTSSKRIADHWELSVLHEGQPSVLRARHVVLATGSQGVQPILPEYRNPERYRGDVLHSVHWRSVAVPMSHISTP